MITKKLFKKAPKKTAKTKSEKGMLSEVDKRIYSIFRLMISLSIALLLSLNTALPTFAEAPHTTGTGKDSPAQAAVTNVFILPINTTTP